MASKRQVEEAENFEVMDRPISKANVHGVLTSLSPVKKGRSTNYFDGTVSDGNSKLHVVGFSVGQQKVMNDFMCKNKRYN